MGEKKMKEVVITKSINITFPNTGGDILLVGNFEGICGKVDWSGQGTGGVGGFWTDDDDFNLYGESFYNNMLAITNTIKNKHKIIFIGSKNTIDYFTKLIYTMMDGGLFGDDLTDAEKHKIFKQFGYINATDIYVQTYKQYNSTTKNRREIAKNNLDDIVYDNIFKKLEGMKFDTIIQNPPYNKSMHLDFFEKGLDLLTDNGQMVIIEPATWLINVRKNGKAKRYDAIKERINGHVESVIIENLNREFNTTLFVPFAITTIDMSKTYDTIRFKCCGEEKEIENLYNCNFIGDYNTTQNILEKVTKFGNMMNGHITNKDMGDKYWYIKFEEKNMLPLCQIESERVGRSYDNSLNVFTKTKNGEFYSKYFTTAVHYLDQEPSNKPLCKRDRGKHITDVIDWNVYGTENEVKNWKHFIFNNKLPLFINIVITISQDNPNKDFLPWLVDKQYTDEEINELFGFTEEEIALIDRTIKKYERNSPWFKRYMCGKDSVSDKEVNNFIQSIK